MIAEDYAIVLDYLSKGKSDSYKSEPVAQVLGTSFFTLLEVVPKVSLKILDKVYIGKEERKEIDHIKKRLLFKELTSTAVSELENAVNRLVEEEEKKFLNFFNSSGSITIRRHQLELLPGLGKKHMLQLLEERKKKPFESFKEIEERIKLMPDPKHVIVKRIIEEMKGEDPKHYLFVRPPAVQRERRY